MVSSMAGKVAMQFLGIYSASKFALEGMADSMLREAAGQGGHVALIEPSGIKTPLVERQLKEVDERLETLSDTERERYGHYCPSSCKMAQVLARAKRDFAHHAE